ncbi:MAG: glucuronate isomerase, partial [Peptoniphilaceae bacterium]|nr:glucuronate isomerase [Peptoniphilaceae bacterium]MDY6019278.1 glucuronate isomerase [Anaerococcus sp.]
MELHIGSIRDNSKKIYTQQGPDVGNDGVNDKETSENLSSLLADFEEGGALPRILLFTLNPKDFYPLSTIGGCFNRQNEEGLMNIQIGTAWWFLDHKNGMVEQMEMLAQTSVFSKFVGMLTDSRSFLSYPRHEYFRRIMCNFIGEIVENGEYPWDEEFLGKMVKDISFKNAKDFIKIDM